MSCARCEADARKRANLAAARELAARERSVKTPVQAFAVGPLNATDIQVINHGIRPFSSDDWPPGRHKLLVLIPEAYTPTCTDQLEHMQQWVAPFDELETDLYLVSSDPPELVARWVQETAPEASFKVLATYLLPARLLMAENGHAKRGLVFWLADGTVMKQEAFPKVAPSFEEAHRVLWAHTTGQYCGCDWVNPASGFLGENVE